MLATPKLIEETRMLREASELQLRILKEKCDQSMAERDELVAFKVSTQKRIEELEVRRGMYELKFSPELDVDAIAHRLEALPPLDGVQVGPSSTKTSRFGDKRNLQTSLREVCARALCGIANLNATREFLVFSLTARAGGADQGPAFPANRCFSRRQRSTRHERFITSRLRASA